MDEYNSWLDFKDLEPELMSELVSVKSDPENIEDRFYKTLKFGTAGLRGVIGAGSNRMNIYVVRQASAGLARYILNTEGEEAASRGVAIAYDSRRLSERFAHETALTLAKFGIHAYLYESLRSVPQLSFTVRHLNCVAGVVITASHNPPQYNGYKVYWSDGGQLPPDRANAVMTEIESIGIFDTVPMDEAQAKSEGLLTIIGRDVDEAYYNSILSLRLHNELSKDTMRNFRVVYSPLHGSGAVPVKTVLERMGVDVVTVPEQTAPDSDFPTVKAPNPEDPKAFVLAEKLARDLNAEVMLATDPDSDRLGVGVLTHNNEYKILTGNQIGSILIHYILTSLCEANALPKNGVVVKSIVSTRMANAICRHFDVTLEEVLTGFRFISEKIELYTNTHEKEYLFGFEESYGFLRGTFARDKDAISSAMLIAECAAFYAQSGKTLSDVLDEMYATYGCFKEGVKSYTLEGKDGMTKIASAMESLRQDTPKELGEYPVISVEDFKSGIAYTPSGETKIDLPTSDVLRFLMDDDAWGCVRPSGTEPKLKLYAGVRASTPEAAQKRLEALMDAIDARLEGILA